MLNQQGENIDSGKVLLRKLFKCILTVNQSVEPLHGLYRIFLHFLFFILSTCVFFKNTNLFAPFINSSYDNLLLSAIDNKYAISINTVAWIVLLFPLTTVLLIIAHLLFEVPLVFSKALNVLLRLTFYLCVPLLDLALSFFNDILDSNYHFAEILVTILLFFQLSICFCFIKFSFSPFGFRNRLWRYSNDLQFYFFYLEVAIVIYIYLDGVTVLTCLLSCIAECYRSQLNNQGNPSKIQKSIFNIWPQLNGVTFFSAGVSLHLKNPSFATAIWFISIVLVIGYHIMTILKQKNAKLFLPVCKASPFEFYGFYVRYRQEIENEGTSSLQFQRKIDAAFEIHKINCFLKGCPLMKLNKNYKYTKNFIRELISDYIMSKSKSSIQNRIVLEIWNLEIKSPSELHLILEKQMSLDQQFITVTAMDRVVERENKMDINNSKKEDLAKLFYDLLHAISLQSIEFYVEILSAKPRIDTIIFVGINMQKNVVKLKTIFNELIKNQIITFRMIQIYHQFFTHFLNEKVLTKQVTEKLIKIQQLNHFEQISSSCLPTLTLYSDSGIIDNINAEGQRFLQTFKFDLKKKNIKDIYLPSIPVGFLKEMCESLANVLHEEDIYAFFIKNQNEFVVGKLIISERFMNRKKLLVLCIEKESFSDLKNMFLVDQNLQIIKMARENQVKIQIGSYANHPIIENWSQIYVKLIKAQRQNLLNQKVIKINTNFKDIILFVRLLSTLSPRHHIVSAHLIEINKKPQKSKARRSFIQQLLQNASEDQHFQFQYQTFNQSEKVQIIGTEDLNELEDLRLHQEDVFEKQLKGKDNQSSKKKKQNYAEDIKTYRLFQKDLYNVDLEDKQAYNDEFQPHQQEIKQKSQVEGNIRITLFMVILAICLSMIGLTIFEITKFNQNHTNLSTLFSQSLNIKSFFIDFNVMLGALRDIQQNHSLLNVQIRFMDESYYRIKSMELSGSFFTNTKYTMEFDNKTLTGSLTELVNVILAHYNQFIYSKQFPTIQLLHTACYTQLNPFITQANADIQTSIDEVIQTSSTLKTIHFFIFVSLLILLYGLIAIFCSKSSSSNQQKLSDLMYISDQESKCLIENAEKLKYAVEMRRKSSKVNLEVLFTSSNNLRRRKHAKQTSLGKQSIYVIILLLVLGLAAHLSFLTSSYLITQSNFNSFITMKAQERAIVDFYPNFVSISNIMAHTSQVNMTHLKAIKDTLNYLTMNRKQLVFSDNLSNFINILFFNDSCPFFNANYNYPLAFCYNSTPGFLVPSPLKIGLAYYFQKQAYYLLDNLTETFAVTGIYSQPFARIFTNLTKIIKDEGIDFINNSFNTTINLNFYSIFICILYIAAFFVMYYYFKRQSQKVDQVMTFLNSKFIRKSNQNENAIQITEDQVELRQEEDEELNGLALNQRRSTIDKVIQEHEN